MRHFARYTDPGFVRVDAQPSDAQNIRASAYFSPDSSQLTVVLLNVGAFDAQLTLSITQDFVASSSEIYRTIFRTGDAGVSETWTALGGLELNQPLALPSRSVATVVLYADAPDAQ
jgi:O-glycosyl hydrolase